MRKVRLRPLGLRALVLVGALAISGCGGGSDGSSGASTTTASSTPSTASAPEGGPSTNTTSRGSSGPTAIPHFALPTGGDCEGAKRDGSATTVPVKVSKVGSQVAVLVDVCLGQKGPFPFQVDSGSGRVTVASQLADRIGLKTIGKPQAVGGAGCSSTEQEVELPKWSLDGLPLQPQKAADSKLPAFGGKGEPQGLIGADVLSRFGAVRIDFVKETLTVVGHEQPIPKNGIEVKRPSKKPLSPALVGGAVKLTAPMTVAITPEEVIASVSVEFPGSEEPHQFAPDTGASESVVDTTLAKGLHLHRTEDVAEQNTACAVVKVPAVQSGPWKLAGHALKPRALGTIELTKTTPSEGLLGADVMDEFGSVVLDFSGGRLMLGAG